MTVLSAQDAFRLVAETAASADVIYNFHCCIAMDDFLLETELFPRRVLEAYSRKNTGKALEPEDELCFSPERGGAQGDYSDGMLAKIANVVDCLECFPRSKRAVIAICNDPFAAHTVDSEAKCVREVHFRLDPEAQVLHASAYFRAHAAVIFPKNLHFLGTLMQDVADGLTMKPRLGELFFVTSVLAGTRQG